MRSDKHTDRQTGIKLTVDLRNVANKPKRCNNTDTHSEHVVLVLIAFPLQNGCMNAPQCYVIRTLPVLFINMEP